MKQHVKRISLIIPVLIALVLAGCDSYSNSKEGTYVGETANLGNGKVRSWVRLDAQGKPETIGVTMTAAALQNLPQHGDHEQHMIALDFPSEAARTPFDHISVDWNPNGHEGVEGYPHFDFHFYEITEAQRAGMVPTDLQFEQKLAKAPAAKFVPANYIQIPGGVPMMGAHWVDANDPVLKGEPFEKMFIYGSYNGKFIFYEPMITKAFIESKTNVTIPIAQPQEFEQPGFYPTHYSIRYDAANDEYTVALEGLTYRS